MAASLLSQRRFWPFFWVSFLTGFNDNVFKQALIVLVTMKGLTLGGLSTEVIQFLAPALIILPFVLASATAGQVSDKWSKATTIRGAKLAELPVMILGSIGLVTENTTALVTTLFLTGLQSTFFGPAKYSFLPEVLEPDELVGGNGLVETGTFLSVLLGTILGGVLVSAGSQGAWLAASATILIALLGIGAAFLVEQRPPADPTLKLDLNPITPNVRIIGATRHDQPVFLSIMGISWFWFFGAAFLSLVPAWVADVAHADATVITLCTAMFSIGIGIGSLWCERLSGGHLELGLVPFGSLGMSLFAIDLAVVGIPAIPSGLDWVGFLSTFDGVRASFDLAMLAMFGGFYTVPLYTMVQQRTDPAKRAQVIAGNNIINSIFIVAASLALLGLRAAGLSIPAIFATLALANLAVTAYIYHIIPEFMLRFCLWIVCSVMYRLRVVDGERFPREGRAIVVANHVTFVDFLFLTAACRRPMRFVMYHAFVDTPILRWMFRDAKVIPIAARHEDPELLERAMDAIAVALDNDELVCLFPEGMVTRDGKMTPFRPGVERIVARTPAPVTPVAIRNLWGSFFSYAGGKPFRRPFRRIRSRIDVVVGEAIAPAEVDAHELALRVAALGGFEAPERARPDNRPDAIVAQHERGERATPAESGDGR
jgi:1-acyl-sn-glycerol-3-phosphate acyltransferase